jgi:hypothetical protein
MIISTPKPLGLGMHDAAWRARGREWAAAVRPRKEIAKMVKVENNMLRMIKEL